MESKICLFCNNVYYKKDQTNRNPAKWNNRKFCSHICSLKSGNSPLIHGKSKTSLYKSWCSMKERCNNENSKSYKNYGGRGITYDPKWGKFEGFYEDMGPIYKDGLTIERVDVNKNYCKANCEWISKSKQSQNTRRTVYITYNGITDTVRGWSERLGLKYITFKKRYYRNRYNLDKVIY